MFNFHASFLRLGAVAAALSALTTFLLWWLPLQVGEVRTFEDSIRLASNPHYMGRLWVNLVHVVIALVAYAAAASLLARRAPATAAFGFLAFLVWAVTEFVGVSVNLFTVNLTWRMQYLDAAPAVQEQLKLLMMGFRGLWDGLFFVVLAGFLAGTLCLGYVAVRGRRLERVVGVLMLMAAPLTVIIILSGYFGYAAFDPVVQAVYPALQPLSRALMGVWLWLAADALVDVVDRHQGR